MAKTKRAYRKKYGKKAKRHPKTKYNPKNGMILVNSKSYGFPDAYKCKLKYSETLQLTATLGATIMSIYRANSLYDPKYAVGGSQPRYYDQLTAVYQKYLVTGCKAKIHWSNQSSTVPANCVIQFGDQDPTGYTLYDLTEFRYSKLTQVGTASGEGNAKSQMYISMGKILGQNSLNSDPYIYTGVNADPIDEVFCTIAATATDGASTVNVYATVELTFYCLFKGVKNVTAS